MAASWFPQKRWFLRPSVIGRISFSARLSRSLDNIAEDAYTQMGLKATGYRTIVARWIKNGWVEKVDKDRFRKTALGLQICNQMMKVAS